MAATTSEKVGFPIRFVAFLIDILILGLVTNVLMSVFGGGFSTDSMMGGSYNGGQGFLSSLVWIGYLVYMDVKYGATLGKKVMKIRVVDAKTGSNLTWTSALLREFVGRLVNSLTLSIGYLWVLWDKDKQGLHDKIGGSYVVKN